MLEATDEVCPSRDLVNPFGGKGKGPGNPGPRRMSGQLAMYARLQMGLVALLKPGFTCSQFPPVPGVWL